MNYNTNNLDTLVSELVPQTQTPPPLMIKDRCDSCNARALTRATHENGSELLFCGHHGRKFELTLVSQGFKVEFQAIND